MKRILMLAFAAALTMGASACQDTTSPGAVLSGTYTLRTVNNQQPPVVLYADPVAGTEELLGGQIQIDRNGTFVDVVTLRDTPPGGVRGAPYDDVINGSWALSGNQVQFTDSRDANNVYYATVSNGQLLFTNYASGPTYTTIYAK